MIDKASGHWRKWVHRTLIAFGMACLIFYSVVTVRAWRHQRAAKSQVEQMISIGRPTAPRHPNAAAALGAAPAVRDDISGVSKPLEPGDIIGRVDIPRLKLSAAVAEGDDDKTLGTAVGHLPDTPLPWHGRGNVALAAHRDGLFRSLEGIRLNDDIRIVTSRGEYHYRVTKMHIVDPDDVWVIAPTDTPTVTLITCYPFSFVGNAPRRFIVKAELVGYPTGSVLTGTVVR
jgi:LPXTG-site transpeptidase (sortase) family protein